MSGRGGCRLRILREVSETQPRVVSLPSASWRWSQTPYQIPKSSRVVLYRGTDLAHRYFSSHYNRANWKVAARILSAQDAFCTVDLRLQQRERNPRIKRTLNAACTLFDEDLVLNIPNKIKYFFKKNTACLRYQLLTFPRISDGNSLCFIKISAIHVLQ